MDMHGLIVKMSGVQRSIIMCGISKIVGRVNGLRIGKLRRLEWVVDELMGRFYNGMNC